MICQGSSLSSVVWQMGVALAPHSCLEKLIFYVSVPCGTIESELRCRYRLHDSYDAYTVVQSPLHLKKYKAGLEMNVSGESDLDTKEQLACYHKPWGAMEGELRCQYRLHVSVTYDAYAGVRTSSRVCGPAAGNHHIYPSWRAFTNRKQSVLDWVCKAFSSREDDEKRACVRRFAST